MFNDIYQRAKNCFQKSPYRFQFTDSAFEKLFLIQEEAPMPRDFFDTYFTLSPSDSSLFRTKILNPNVLDTFDRIIESLTLLKTLSIDDACDCNAIVTHKLVLNGLWDLHDEGILNTENLNLIIAHNELTELAFVLSQLNKASILNAPNRDAVASKFCPRALTIALITIHEAGITLSTENRENIVAHDNPRKIAYGLVSLQQKNILTPDNQDAVVKHPRPNYLVEALINFQQAHILIPFNRITFARNNNPKELAWALGKLNQATILNQANFEALVADTHASLLSEQMISTVWARIPRHLLTQENFQRLLTAAENVDPLTEINRITALILGIADRVGPTALFNPNQSTHTTSVHASVSQSAKKLAERYYGESFELERIIKKIKIFVTELGDSVTHQAVKRCISRLTSVHEHYRDPVSQVSTLQLLALAYTAIHDEKNCQVSLEQAKFLFVEGLYEVQRGYNMEAPGGDDGYSYDVPICVSGTANSQMKCNFILRGSL